MSIRKLIAPLVLVVSLAGFSWLHGKQAKPKFTADDYAEIQNLYATYAHLIDAGEGERFAGTFVDGGEFTHGFGPGRGAVDRTPAKGKEALAKVAGNGGTRHFVADLVITPTEEGAKGSCYLLLYSARTIPASLSMTGIYDDILVKTPQGWRFKKRIFWRDDDDISPFRPKPLPQPGPSASR